MPAAALNDRNPLIRILQQGLLDHQVQPKTGRDGGLGYELTGRDVSALKRTCRAADSYLQMTEQHEINHLVRVSMGIRGIAPPETGVRKAKFFISGIVEKKCGVGPKDVYEALVEMCLLSTRLHLVKSTADQRMIAIVFATVMHAQSGHLTNARHALDHLRYMRGFEAHVYKDFLGRMGQLAHEEADELAGVVGGLYCAYDLIGRAAFTATHGAGIAKLAATLTAPLWPLAAVQGALLAVGCVPIAVGLACKGQDLVRQAVAYAQIDFYKDAVVFDMLFHPQSWLMHEHDEQNRLIFFDGREPPSANTVGREHLRKMFNAYCTFMIRLG